MALRRKNLTVIMNVADIGEFNSTLSLTQTKSIARFKRSGQPDLMGNHLYVDSSGGIQLCALRTNNGTLDRQPNGQYFWRGIVRYTSYKLIAPEGFVIVTEDGQIGPEITLHDGLTLEFLPRSTIECRFAICRADHAALAAAKLTYQDGTHTWMPLAGDYGPSELPLPSTGQHNYEGQSANEYQAWLQAWRTGEPLGTWESNGARIGPKMPAGHVPPYAQGGDGIDPNHGYERSRSNILLRRWKHSRWMDRMNCAMFGPTGRQLTPTSFSSPQQIQQLRGPGMWQWENDLPPFLVGGWANAQYPHFNVGPTDLQNETWEYKSIWISHYIRAIQDGIAVWEYTHDPMIADDLVMLFEAARFWQFSDRGDEEDSGAYIPPSIRAYMTRINNWQHNGSPDLDRASGWAMYLGSQVNRMGFSRLNWLRKMKVLHDRAMMPATGIAGRKFAPEFPRPDIQGIQTFHEMIIGIGYHAVCTQLDKSASIKLAPLCAAVLDNEAMPTIAETYHPDGTQKGPPHWIWTHINYDELVTLASQYSNGGGDAAHVSQVLALAFLADGDVRWLNASLQNWWIAPNLQVKLLGLQGMYDKSWGATLQAVLESQNI